MRADSRHILRPYLPYISFLDSYKYPRQFQYFSLRHPGGGGGLHNRAAMGLEPTTPHRVLYGAVGASAPNYSTSQPPLDEFARAKLYHLDSCSIQLLDFKTVFVWTLAMIKIETLIFLGSWEVSRLALLCRAYVSRTAKKQS